MILQQRKCASSVRSRIPFLLLSAFFAFFLHFGRIDRVTVPTPVLYDAASILCQVQGDAPVLTEGIGEPSAEGVCGEVLPLPCFMARFDPPAAPGADIPAGTLPPPRRFRGLIPFSLAPPALT